MKKKMNITEKLISSHLMSGEMQPGQEIGIKIDHILQQDATGTLVMLELEAMNLKKVKTETAVQYVDHNLLQADHKNADDHVFLQSAARKFGYWYSRPGNGVSHPVHMERFGTPGKTMVGSDSHTCGAGSLGMLAIGTGGLDVAQAAAGEPYFFKMPKVMGVHLKGQPPDWVSAKDVILEMLRRYDVKGGVGYVIEYFGEGLKHLSAWDRHVIANMGAELGATTTVFPSDERTRQAMAAEQREKDWTELIADKGATYDAYEEIMLDEVVPLIAKPHSPGNVVAVKDLEGLSIHQAMVGSSANPGLRDFWMAGEIVKDKTVHPNVSFDINPTSRENIQNMTAMGTVGNLIQAGARFHQSGCMGCIGMGQAPAEGKVSLRTVPRNFKGRSGTLDDQVYLCSPETAAASALTGVITDPRDMEQTYNMSYPVYQEPKNKIINTLMLIAPDNQKNDTKLVKGKNIKTIPDFNQLEDHLQIPVILKMNDNISTDEILKAGADVLPLRSNIPKISKYAFYIIDKNFHTKAKQVQEKYIGHIVVAGENYAQGSSREHAALAPKYLGQKAVIAKSYARIGWQNLVNFGIVPFEFVNPDDYDHIQTDDVLECTNIRKDIMEGNEMTIRNVTQNSQIKVKTSLSERQKHIVLFGGLINLLKEKISKNS